MTDDCCPGEPFHGDPRGLHSEDCPVYLRWADAHVAASRARVGRRRREPPIDPIALAYQIGYRHGLEGIR